MMQREGLPYRTLLQLGAQRRPAPSAGCRVALELLAAAAAARNAFRRAFADLGVGELDFEVLVSLFALDAAAATPALLAAHTAATRPAITESMDRLEARGLVRRERDRVDRRSLTVRLTPAGVSVAQECAARFLDVADRLAAEVAAAPLAFLTSVCAHVCRASADIPSSTTPRLSQQ